MNKNHLLSVTAIAALSNPIFAQEEVPLRIHKAIELEVETGAGFDYQFFKTSDLNQETPIGPILSGTGNARSVFARANRPREFYRVERIPNEVENFIPGLISLSLDTAQVKNNNDGVKVTGARVVSNEYDEDDYLSIDYKLDLLSQGLEIEKIRAFKDVGPTTSDSFGFFLRDSENEFAISYGENMIPYNVPITLQIPPEGLVINLDLKINQACSYTIVDQTDVLNLRALDADEQELTAFKLATNSKLFASPIKPFKEGRHTLQITPASGQAASMEIHFQNTN